MGKAVGFLQLLAEFAVSSICRCLGEKRAGKKTVQREEGSIKMESINE